MKIAFYIFLFSFVFLESAFAQINRPLAEVGQSNYLNGNFQEAKKNFNSAFDQSPNNASLAYNLANSQYRLGQFEKALQSFNQAAFITQNSQLKQKSYYNAGNALFKLGKLEQAISSYKNALELNPDDMDAKYNLEFTRKHLKKRKKNRQQNNQQKKSSNKDNKNSKKQDSNKSNLHENQENKKDSKEKQKTVSRPDNKKESLKNKQEQKNEKHNNHPLNRVPQQEGFSKEQAEQLLRSINENYKKFGQIQAKKLKPNSEYRGKDW